MEAAADQETADRKELAVQAVVVLGQAEQERRKMARLAQPTQAAAGAGLVMLRARQAAQAVLAS